VEYVILATHLVLHALDLQIQNAALVQANSILTMLPNLVSHVIVHVLSVQVQEKTNVLHVMQASIYILRTKTVIAVMKIVINVLDLTKNNALTA
jgi:hypothetical protein